jgi:hypothetical protein
VLAELDESPAVNDGRLGAGFGLRVCLTMMPGSVYPIDTEVKLQCSMKTTGSATISIRYSFAPQLIAGAVALARRAARIERIPAPKPKQIAEHRALVVGAVVQGAAALEASLNEVVLHGSSHHLGGNIAPLVPHASKIDRAPGGLVKRWELALRLLNFPPPSGQIPEDAQLLMLLRNELTHYRSGWNGTTKSPNLMTRLQNGNVAKDPYPQYSNNMFPLAVLSAHLARWAAVTASNYLDEIYAAMGVASPLDGNRRPGADYASLLPARQKPTPKPPSNPRKHAAKGR